MWWVLGYGELLEMKADDAVYVQRRGGRAKETPIFIQTAPGSSAHAIHIQIESLYISAGYI